MDLMDFEQILSNLVCVGIVTSVDNEQRLARVKFEGEQIESGLLHVLASQPYIPNYEGPQCTETASGGSGAAAYESHSHDLVIKPWMPKIGDSVLVLYLPVFDADGFILGRI